MRFLIRFELPQRNGVLEERHPKKPYLMRVSANIKLPEKTCKNQRVSKGLKTRNQFAQKRTRVRIPSSQPEAKQSEHYHQW